MHACWPGACRSATTASSSTTAYFETGQGNQYLLAIFDDLFSKLVV